MPVKRKTRTQPTEKDTAGQRQRPWTPLPPPRRNRWLLGIAWALLLVWLVVLVLLSW
jgi:hypothetical protein